MDLLIDSDIQISSGADIDIDSFS